MIITRALEEMRWKFSYWSPPAEKMTGCLIQRCGLECRKFIWECFQDEYLWGKGRKFPSTLLQSCPSELSQVGGRAWTFITLHQTDPEDRESGKRTRLRGRPSLFHQSNSQRGLMAEGGLLATLPVAGVITPSQKSDLRDKPQYPLQMVTT